ncbi:hypothetical protein [Bradyrhizobium australiense]|uniref:hypothetical protein n=1 Tax=Bradyrhizobium australiense TaxID=2721161 RepID=UPI00289BC795|nr:hypothetical protein [Bradyrhizobium australiense]
MAAGRRLQLVLLALAAFLLMTTLAGAAGEKSARPSEFLLLAQIALLIAVGRGLGELMQRIGQPSVMGDLLGGQLLGPSLFGWLWPAAHTALFAPSPEQKALIEGHRAVRHPDRHGNGPQSCPQDRPWRRSWRPYPKGILRARKRHECARLNRSHHCDHWSFH